MKPRGQVPHETSADLLTITTYGPTAGSARVRVFDWLDWLKLDSRNETYIGESTNSPKALIGSLGRVGMAELRLRKLAYLSKVGRLLLSRQASPFSNGEIEEQLLSRARHGVYDFDDALMYSDNGRLEKLWSKRKTWTRSVSAADVVIAGNNYLADRASQLNENVIVIPSCVDPDMYQQKLDYSLGDVPRAVWLGSPSTEHYLELITPALLALNKSIGLRLTVISAGQSNLGSLRPVVDRISWSLDGFSRELRNADFGIMPLDDNEWTRGKCAYKLLQYGAAGLPLIGSPVGQNESVLASSLGFSPTTKDEWVSAVEALVGETSAARKKRGERARKTIVDQYSFAAWESTWRNALALSNATNDS